MVLLGLPGVIASCSPSTPPVPERTGVVTSRGAPVTLLGTEISVGDTAPLFTAADRDFARVNLADLIGNVVLINVVPSLDTPVCSVQTQRFNRSAASMADDAVFITISTDLPFAQRRFCAAEGIDDLLVLSDAVWREFGLGYGVLIKDRGLLARSVWVIGRDGRVAYRELVSDSSSEPDYTAALRAVSSALQSPKT